MAIRLLAFTSAFVLAIACGKGDDKKAGEPSTSNDNAKADDSTKTGTAGPDEPDSPDEKPPGEGGGSAGGGVNGVGGGSPPPPPPGWKPPVDTRTDAEKAHQVKLITLGAKLQSTLAEIAQLEMLTMKAAKAMQQAGDPAAKEAAAKKAAEVATKLEQAQKKKLELEKELAAAKAEKP